MEESLLSPEFLRRLGGAEIRTVLLAGCGGGFDFVHGMLIYKELLRRGKRVVIGSYSFGDPTRIGGPTTAVFEAGGVVVRRVSAASAPDPYYCPEVHLCAFLDSRFPAAAPHEVYAYYARAFTVPLLRELYLQLVSRHAIDAIVIVDGGSDSLMRGDEEGLGDPIEDSVSVAAVASVDAIEARILLSVGLGCDRYNQVSDAASLRAVAELTAAGGFLGAVTLHRGADAFGFYRDCIDFIDSRQGFRSVLSGCIIAAGEGQFGHHVPPRLRSRVKADDLYLWPLMATLWGFDVERVAERSLTATWIRDQTTVAGCYEALARGRAALGAGLRPVENLPRHETMRCRGQR
jgi:hypothetical protein